MGGIRLLVDLARAVLVALIVAAIPVGTAVWFMTSMPGESHEGPPAGDAEAAALATALREHVVELAQTIGERNFDRFVELEQAAAYVSARLAAVGCAVERRDFVVWEGSVSNLVCELPGGERADEIVVVGAHYDSVGGSPGANDNASGVAVLLELAGRMQAEPRQRTLRFVAFGNEEPPFFQTPRMGSYVYANEVVERAENVVAMLSIETVGFYSEAPGSQGYPPPFHWLYPDRGNFVALVANPFSRGLLRRAIASFRGSGAAVGSEGIAAPGFVQGVAWSDQWAFWLHGIPAIMVTDTAPFRDRAYHTAGDTPERLDYRRMASLVRGLAAVVLDLVSGPAG
ncbi:MAG: M28 family peptidase [Myxococcota bacterium]|nr:M28 family peptidase [Myxococcota bacterium]